MPSGSPASPGSAIPPPRPLLQRARGRPRWPSRRVSLSSRAAGERRRRFRRVKPRPFVLTPRDRRVLELVEEYRLLSSEQIIALLDEGSPQVLIRRLGL